MPTIADNIDAMAKLVADTKKKHHLTESTVLRIVDMNFALAQAAGAPTFGGEEPIPFDPSLIPMNGEDLSLDVFPETETDIEAVEEDDIEDESDATTLATVEHKELN